MKLAKMLSTMAAAAMLCAPASAQLSGNSLLRYLQARDRVNAATMKRPDPQTVYDGGFSTGFVAGVLDALVRSNEICPGTGVELAQAVDEVHLYLQRNPGIRDLAAVDLTADALKRAFPCLK